MVRSVACTIFIFFTLFHRFKKFNKNICYEGYSKKCLATIVFKHLEFFFRIASLVSTICSMYFVHQNRPSRFHEKPRFKFFFPPPYLPKKLIFRAIIGRNFTSHGCEPMAEISSWYVRGQILYAFPAMPFMMQTQIH